MAVGGGAEVIDSPAIAIVIAVNEGETCGGGTALEVLSPGEAGDILGGGGSGGHLSGNSLVLMGFEYLDGRDAGQIFRRHTTGIALCEAHAAEQHHCGKKS